MPVEKVTQHPSLWEGLGGLFRGLLGGLLILLLCLFSFSTARAQKIGLVLGGGGAKGGAEVGVLKVLEEAGVRPDFIVGTSIGAVVGGLYAAGFSAAELEQMFTQQQWISLLTDRSAELGNEPYKVKDGVTYIFGFPVLDNNSPTIGLLQGARVEQVIDSMMAMKGCVEFDCLPTPFRCVAASMMDAEEVVLSEGTLPSAIRASMAIPGVFKPVEIDGEQLVDGGMMNNLPVDVARQMGADIIIAVDLQQNKPQNRQPQPDNILTSIANALGFGAIVNWVINRPDITKYNENRRHCDIYINPPLPDDDATSFGNARMTHMIQVGQQAARQHIDRLRQLAHP
ncbi:MAG: patatin-like phospholipase family protein [Prevotella sp.]|nr:patatin-like phospholipase family protein [Prevotella sp.]